MSGSITTSQNLMLNVFGSGVDTGNGALSAVTLTTAINNVPFAPGLLGSMGLFFSDGVPTTSVAIAMRNGLLQVVKTSPRGAPPEHTTHPKRTMQDAKCVHLAIEDHVYADEVQNAVTQARMNGQPDLQAAEELAQDRLDGPFGLRARIELTHEFHRLGALQGIVVDADGSLLYDWFDFFKIQPPADHNTNFGALTADGATFEMECTAMARDMVVELEGLPLATMVPVAFAGNNYFDQVWSNKEVKAARKNRDTGRDSDVFASNRAFKSFEFGGIQWVNYRGTKDGLVGINPDEARLFPMGVPGLFQQLFGPADIFGQTNMKGLPVHAYMPPESQTSRLMTMEAQSNPLTFCAKPRSCRKLTKS